MLSLFSSSGSTVPSPPVWQMTGMGNLRRDYLTSAALADGDCVLPLYLFRRKDDADGTVRAFLDMASAPEGMNSAEP